MATALAVSTTATPSSFRLRVGRLGVGPASYLSVPVVMDSEVPYKRATSLTLLGKDFFSLGNHVLTPSYLQDRSPEVEREEMRFRPI